MEISRNLFHYLDCTSMDFEQMQKIWDEEKKENFFVINEEAMRKTVTSKKRSANREINVTEIGLILVNSITTATLLVKAVDNGTWPSYLGVGIMIFTILYLFFIRHKRKKADNTFDRTMLGELDHAIANVKATISIGKTMIYWYIFPIGIYSVTKMLYEGAPLSKWLLILGAFALGYFVSTWSVNKQQIPRKKKLEQLRAKLMEDS